jgi:hypothetical protein
VKLKGDDLVTATSCGPSSSGKESLLWVVARDLRGGETVGGPYCVIVVP